VTITLDQVLSVFDDLLGEPDRANPEVDETCVYTDQDGNHCIAGEVITRLGGTVPEFGAFGNTDNLAALADKMPNLLAEFDHDALYLLEDAQESADNGYTWHGTIEKIHDDRVNAIQEDS
jgi:hypothetical protein